LPLRRLILSAILAVAACTTQDPADASDAGASWSADVGAQSSTTNGGWTQYKAEGAGKCGIRWHVNEIKYLLDERGLQDVTKAEFQTAAQQALQTWQGVQCGLCADKSNSACNPATCAPHPLGLSLKLGGFATAAAPGAVCTQHDAVGNCTTIEPNGNYFTVFADKSEWPFGAGVIALTKLTYNEQDGTIADADVMLNDAYVTFTPASLCYTLTHEVGHTLGLDHSGNVQATMYASGVKKDGCALHDDDRLGICTVYRQTCGTCAHAKTGDDGGLCSARRVAHGRRSVDLLAMLVLSMGYGRWRSSTRARSQSA
jgi:hypothetical protein